MDAGWYDDPFRRFVQRYHDGDDWTEHVSDGSGVSFEDPSGTSSHVIGSVPLPPPPHGDDGSGYGADLLRTGAASPWARLGARLLDAVIVGVPLYLLVSVLFEPPIEFSDDLTAYEVHAAPYLLLTVLLAVYEIAMIGTSGRTLGKMATGVVVVGGATAGLPGYGRATIRWVAFLLYNIPYGIGMILGIATIVMIFVDARRQTIHDKVAGTVVLRSARN